MSARCVSNKRTSISPVNTTRWHNTGLMLVHRLRWWPNIKPALVQRLVSVGKSWSVNAVKGISMCIGNAVPLWPFGMFRWSNHFWICMLRGSTHYCIVLSYHTGRLTSTVIASLLLAKCCKNELARRHFSAGMNGCTCKQSPKLCDQLSCRKKTNQA